MRYQGPGRTQNAQQGTQSPRLTGRPAGSYSRSSQRAAPTGSTTFTDSTAAEKDARDKKHKTGKYASQRLFP